MTLLRFLGLFTILTVGLTAGPVSGQDATKLPQPTGFNLISERRDQRGIAKEELKTAQGQFQNFAKYYADVISHPLVHKAAQDPGLKVDATGRDIPTVDGIIKSLDRFILEPNASVRTASDNPNPKVNIHNADYIRELGFALDAALKPIVETHPERVVRINAARLYAAVCSSGANAHWPTVTAWVSNPNTPTEIKYYALQAAANLLEAGDVFDYKGRRHAFDENPRSGAEKKIGQLIAAVQDCVVNPNAIIAIPDGKVENATPDQLAVVGFVRKQAIKTLGRVRFVEVPGPAGVMIYPAFTLVRVCMSDPALVPAPAPAECAEAIIGLCNMAPSRNTTPLKGFNADAVAEAITTGLITFAGPRASNPLDRSLPWRGYAMRMADAFKAWRPLFDPLYDPTQPTKFDAGTVPKDISDLITRAQTAVLVPIEKVDVSGKPDLAARVDIEGLKAFLKQLQSKPKRSGLLITGVPATALPKTSGN
ncbi:MAG: hypothetical protein C0467_07375 [Planctomycetaceae bacterium]|nr:hypothetical protein [Planctomycetaceae bacterium]